MNNSLKLYKILLVTLISSVCITGIGFIDDKIWNLIFSIVGIIAYAIVGLLFSFGLLSGKKAGREAYILVFIILIIIGFYMYQGIVSFQQWIISWPLYVKVIVTSILTLAIILIAILLILKNRKLKREKTT